MSDKLKDKDVKVPFALKDKPLADHYPCEQCHVWHDGECKSADAPTLADQFREAEAGSETDYSAWCNSHADEILAALEYTENAGMTYMLRERDKRISALESQLRAVLDNVPFADTELRRRLYRKAREVLGD